MDGVILRQDNNKTMSSPPFSLLQPFSLAIIGSRTFSNQKLTHEVFSLYYGERIFYITKFVSGGAKGADSMAKVISQTISKPLIEYLPDWEKHGKSAGFIRNQDIIKNSDEILCFWDGISKGTANSLTIAKKLKKPTVIYYF